MEKIDPNLGGILIVIITLLSIIIFVLIREFWCWYWKINEKNAILANINTNLDFIVELIKQKQADEKEKPQ